MLTAVGEGITSGWYGLSLRMLSLSRAPVAIRMIVVMIEKTGSSSISMCGRLVSGTPGSSCGPWVPGAGGGRSLILLCAARFRSRVATVKIEPR